MWARSVKGPLGVELWAVVEAWPHQPDRWVAALRLCRRGQQALRLWCRGARNGGGDRPYPSRAAAQRAADRQVRRWCRGWESLGMCAIRLDGSV